MAGGSDLARSQSDSSEDLAFGDSAPTAAAASPPPPLIRQAVTWLSLGFGPVLAIITYYPLILAVLQHQEWIYKIFSDHYDVIFGLPSAALLSFMLVVVSEARFDRIEMEISNEAYSGNRNPATSWLN
jgi:hypothetical protein